MNTIALQLKLRGPTDKLVRYLEDLKFSIQGDIDGLLAQGGKEVNECEAAVQGLRRQLGEEKEDLASSQSVVGSLSPIVEHLESTRSLKEFQLETYSNHLYSLNSI